MLRQTGRRYRVVLVCLYLKKDEGSLRQTEVMTGEGDLTAGVRGWSRGIMSSCPLDSTEVCKYLLDFT